MFQWLINLFKPHQKPINTPNIIVKNTPVQLALCTACNKYLLNNGANDLHGCINDAHDTVSYFLNQNFKTVKTLLDEKDIKPNVVDLLTSMISEANSGDTCIWTNSSHGTIIQNPNDPIIEEAICTHDFNFDDPNTILLNHDIAKILSNLKEGVVFIMVMDNCHSSSNDRSITKNKKRFIKPNFVHFPVNKPQKFTRNLNNNHILIAGCADQGTSEETQQMNGDIRGVLSYYLFKELRKGSYNSWQDVFNAMVTDISKAGYDQQPSLSGADWIKELKPC